MVVAQGALEWRATVDEKRSRKKAGLAGSAPVSPGDQAKPGTPGTGEVICRECRGSGTVNGAPCRNCGGSGKVVAGVGGA